jgi:transporter family protein
VWIVFVLFSAIGLGFYDIAQKVSLRDNAVLPVLFFSIVSTAVLLTPVLLLSRFGGVLCGTPFYVPPADLRTHLYIILKSCIVLTAWLFLYAGMKHLPLTLVEPIKATQPIFTVVGAMLIFAERLNGYQAVGVVITLLCFYLFSVVGKKEGLSFRRNKWVWCLILGTLANAGSALYDKYLMHQFNRMTVQVYYSYYQVLAMGVITWVLWYRKRSVGGGVTPFRWRWSVVMIGAFLCCSDFLYFYALSIPGSLVSVVSTFRNAGQLLPFAYGAFFFKEKNLKWKVFCLIGALSGIYFLFLGSW